LSSVTWDWAGTNYSIYDNSLVLMLNLDNVSGLNESDSQATDVSGYGNNASVNGGAVWTSNGRYNGAYSFNGISSYLEIPDSSSVEFSGSQDFTISEWIKPAALGQYADFFDKTAYAWDYYVFELWFFLNTDGKVHINVGDEYVGWQGLTSTASYTTGWMNVVVVKSGDNITLYLNGAPDSSFITTYTGVSANNMPIDIGRFRRDNDAYFNGSIDEVRVYRRALSSGEVRQLYLSNLNEYAPGQWQFQANESVSALGAANYTYQACAADQDDSQNCTATQSLTVDAIPPQTGFSPPTPANGTITNASSALFNVSINDSELCNFTWDWNGTNYTPYDSSLITLFNFDNVSALGENDSYVFDASGYGNDGSCDLADGYCPAWTVAGEYGGAYQFGDDDAFSTNPLPALFGANPRTVSMWIQTNQTETQGFFESGYPSVDFQFGLYVVNAGDAGAFPPTNPGGLALVFFDDDIYVPLGVSAIADGNWHMITVTLDGSGNAAVYIDGALPPAYKWNDRTGGWSSLQSQPIAFSGIDTDPDTVLIGQTRNQYWGLGNAYFSGSIDEVRIYDRVLSAAEVQQLYLSNLNEYAPGQWQFQINESTPEPSNQSNASQSNYTYQACAADQIGNWNCTADQLLTESQLPSEASPDPYSGNGQSLSPVALTESFNCSSGELEVLATSSGSGVSGLDLELLNSAGLSSMSGTTGSGGQATFTIPADGTYRLYSLSNYKYLPASTDPFQFALCPAAPQNASVNPAPQQSANLTAAKVQVVAGNLTTARQNANNSQTQQSGRANSQAAASSAMASAQSAISSAQAAIRAAQSAGKVTTAAQARLTAAQSAYSAGNYAQASELAVQAETLASGAGPATTVQPVPASSAQNPPSGGAQFLWLVIVAVLIILLGGAYLLRSGSKKAG
jgi:hypothetical protein